MQTSPSTNFKYSAPNRSMHLSTATWTKDSHGLFDYEDMGVQRKGLVARSVKYLVREPSADGEVELLGEEEVESRKIPDQSLLLKIVPNKENPESFLIESCSKTGRYEDATDKLWLIINSLKRDNVKEVLLRINARSTS